MNTILLLIVGSIIIIGLMVGVAVAIAVVAQLLVSAVRLMWEGEHE